MTTAWPIGQKRMEAFLEAVRYCRNRAEDLTDDMPDDALEWADLAEILRREGGLTGEKPHA
jgi:hypothetical protein